MHFFIQSKSLLITGIFVLFAISLLTYNNTFQIPILHETEASISDGNGSLNIQQNQPLQQQNQPLDDNLIIGSFGNDRITGTINDDIIVGGVDDDYLIGGNGNDKLYGDIGDDILSGLKGADYFDCGDGVDVIIDFSLNESDDTAGNCEEIQNN